MFGRPFMSAILDEAASVIWSRRPTKRARAEYEMRGYAGPRVHGPLGRLVLSGAASRRKLGRYGYKPHQGPREMARRVRQEKQLLGLTDE